MNWEQAIAYSSTAGKRTVILPRMTFGLSSGATSMHRPFQLCMRNTRSVEVGLCSTRRILNRSPHF